MIYSSRPFDEVQPVYIEDSQGVVQQRLHGWAPNDSDDELFCYVKQRHRVFFLQLSDSEFMELDVHCLKQRIQPHFVLKIQKTKGVP